MRNYRLHLIRHGRTEDNDLGLLAGSGRDSHLSAQGKATLAQMRETFAYPPVEALFVSPMMRAVETAQILYPDQRPILIPPLAECYFGELEGRPSAQVAESGFWERWRQAENPFTPAGGESHEDFCRRAREALAGLFTAMMRAGIHNAAAVTHGGVIAAMLAGHGLPRKEEDMWAADNGAGYTLSVSAAVWQQTAMAEVTAIVPGGYMENDGRPPEEGYFWVDADDDADDEEPEPV